MKNIFLMGFGEGRSDEFIPSAAKRNLYLHLTDKRISLMNRM